MAVTPLECLKCGNKLFISYIDKGGRPYSFYYLCSKCGKMYKFKNELEKGEPQEDPSSYLVEKT